MDVNNIVILIVITFTFIDEEEDEIVRCFENKKKSLLALARWQPSQARPEQEDDFFLCIISSNQI